MRDHDPNNLPPRAYGPGARPTDPGTCWGAAKAYPAARASLRDAVLALHREHRGLTDDDLSALMPDQLVGSLSKRRGELVADGLLVDSGRRRRTRRGCHAIVWRCVLPGEGALVAAQPVLPLDGLGAMAQAS